MRSFRPRCSRCRCDTPCSTVHSPLDTMRLPVMTPHCTTCNSIRPGQMKVYNVPGFSWCLHQRAALTGHRPAPQEIMHILQAATRQPDAGSGSGYC